MTDENIAKIYESQITLKKKKRRHLRQQKKQYHKISYTAKTILPLIIISQTHNFESHFGTPQIATAAYKFKELIVIFFSYKRVVFHHRHEF